MATAERIPPARPAIILTLTADEAEAVRAVCGCWAFKEGGQRLASSVYEALKAVNVESRGHGITASDLCHAPGGN